jgi:ferredoxin-NADP reductase
VIPPTGRFLPVFEPEKHLVCIAGGSGVTPFRAFAREASARGLATRITILYSVRTPCDIIFHEEFRKLEQANPRFKFLVTCTRLAADEPWAGRRGRIEAAWIREHIGEMANTVFYACGPNAMVEAAEHLVTSDLGVPKEQMKAEKWG